MIMKGADLLTQLKKEEGPRELHLHSIVQFPRYVAPGSHDSASFEDFIAALSANRSIEKVHCNRHFTTGLSDEEWCRTIQALGRLPSLKELVFVDGGDSRLRRVRLELVASLLRRDAPQLQRLEFQERWLLIGDEPQRRRFARALREHPSLEFFSYAGCGPVRLYQSIAPRSNPDLILQALTSCPNIKVVRLAVYPYHASDYSEEALQRLAGKPGLTELAVVTRHWHAIATVLREESCTLETLRLINHTTRVPVADSLSIARVVKNNKRLQSLSLQASVHFEDRGLYHLAMAVKKSKILKQLVLSDRGLYGQSGNGIHPKWTSAGEYLLLADMLKANPMLDLQLRFGQPPSHYPFSLILETYAVRRDIRMFSILNNVGRNKLTNGSPTPKDWCEALCRLNDLSPEERNDASFPEPLSEALNLSCFYELVRMRVWTGWMKGSAG
jgi:hypothetical protein